ncbi:MAG: polyprenyl synthetase family protein [Bacteroidota bacterium]|nr:MAG: polyprenyl synthetase family protein [Bacteroidota bacterium]
MNALWKNKIAVLVGDYLLSKGLLLSLGNGDFKILEILSDAVREMAEGELLQAEKPGSSILQKLFTSKLSEGKLLPSSPLLLEPGHMPPQRMNPKQV